jgi:hypothetical protein
MSLRTVLGDVVLRGTAQVAGTYSSGPITNPGAASTVLVLVHVSAVGGSTQTFNVKLQSSPDNSTWTDVPGASATALTAIGTESFNALIPDRYAQVVAVVGGTGSPTVTSQIAVMVMS